MNLDNFPIGNAYERLAINLCELIYDLDDEQDPMLRELLIKAYRLAYLKAVSDNVEEPLAMVG